MLGTYALSAGYYDAYYGQAQKVRTLIKRDFDKAFEKVDLIACPSAPTTAFEIGVHKGDPLSMYLEDIEVHDNAQEVNNHAGEMGLEPDFNANMLVHDCEEGVYFKTDMTVEQYFAQDNGTWDLGIQDDKEVTLVDSAFNVNKIRRVV